MRRVRPTQGKREPARHDGAAAAGIDGRKGRITLEILNHATAKVDRMDLAAKMVLVDEIFAAQPNLLASVLVLHRMGVGLAEIDVAIRILQCTFQAMKDGGLAWPLVTEQIQETCLKRVTGRARFTEGLTSDQAEEVGNQFVTEHREPYLLAFVQGTLKDHDLLASARSEVEKYLLMAVLNLVECVAVVGASATGQAESREAIAP